MCIRDRYLLWDVGFQVGHSVRSLSESISIAREDIVSRNSICLLYTSDAADERSSVDLGGRRIITKKKKKETINNRNRIAKEITLNNTQHYDTRREQKTHETIQT